MMDSLKNFNTKKLCGKLALSDEQFEEWMKNQGLKMS